MMIRMLQSCFKEVLSLIPDDLEARQLETARLLGVLKQKKSLQTSWPTGFHVFLWCLPFGRALLLLNKHRFYVDSGMGAAPFQARRLVESLNPSGVWLSMAQHGSAWLSTR